MSEFSNRLRQLRESMKPVRSMTVTSQLMGYILTCYEGMSVAKLNHFWKHFV